MVTHYGMSEAFELATYEARLAPLYLNGPTLPEPCTFSERTADAIGGEVRRLLEESRERVTQTLRTHRETLESLATLLLEKEVVDRAMLDETFWKRSSSWVSKKPISAMRPGCRSASAIGTRCAST